MRSESNDFIAAAYKALLMREPDEEGLATFTPQLAGETPDYAAFLAALLGSAEFLSNIDAIMEHYHPGAWPRAAAPDSPPAAAEASPEGSAPSE